jgi:hypothetical protein
MGRFQCEGAIVDDHAPDQRCETKRVLAADYTRVQTAGKNCENGAGEVELDGEGSTCLSLSLRFRIGGEADGTWLA